MKTLPAFCLATCLASVSPALAGDAPKTAPAASAKAPAAPPLSPRFQQVRDRIAALFHLRNETPAPPDPRANPFRPSGPAASVAVATPGSASPLTLAPEPDQPGGDLALLQQAVATLKITGVVELRGEAHIGINTKLYKKGDVVQAVAQAQPVYLRVREITRRSATLTLNDAEMTLKF